MRTRFYFKITKEKTRTQNKTSIFTFKLKITASRFLTDLILQPKSINGYMYMSW